MRWIWCTHRGTFVPPEEAVRPHLARSGLPTPQVVTDTMEPVRSMLDGRMYDSKAALRATYRAAGVTEVGNDAPTKRGPRPEPDREAIKGSVVRAMSAVGFGGME